MQLWAKISTRTSSVRRGGAGGYLHRRRTRAHDQLFYIVLALSVASAVGFFGLLAVAIAGG